MTLFPEFEPRVDSETLDPSVFWTQLHGLTDVLDSDLQIVADHLTDNDQQVWRRTYYRTFFAYLEGHVDALKQLFLFYDWWKVDEEMELQIRNVRRQVKTDGVARLVPAYIPLIENMKMVFRALATAAGVEPVIADDDEMWAALTRAIKVRNRIVHPRKAEDLAINDEEVALIAALGSWFSKCVALIRKKQVHAILRVRRIMREAAKRQFGPETDAKAKPRRRRRKVRSQGSS